MRNYNLFFINITHRGILSKTNFNTKHHLLKCDLKFMKLYCTRTRIKLLGALTTIAKRACAIHC